MKAVIYREYGSPDDLSFEEVEKPIPRENEVLIKIRAVSINDWDWGLLRGKPFINRILFGLTKPKKQILGSDVAGVVEAVGQNVTKFDPGDEVFGDLSGEWGGFAEYVCAAENALTKKPDGMTFEEAAAIPQAGLLALQGLLKQQIQPENSVLINGAGGGAGTFAVQIAKSFGAEVTGVDRTSKLDLMRSLGADHVINFTEEDFTKNSQQYDLILDAAAHHSIFDYRRSLNPNGNYVMLGGASSRIIQVMLLGRVVSMTNNKKLGALMHKPNKEMDLFIKLFESGKVKPVIDRCYSLNEVAEAFHYFGEGQAKGKLVVTLDQS